MPGCPAELLGTYDEVVGPELEKECDLASRFGTTLWFTDTNKIDEVLEALLICGQASMCFTLLTYLVELRGTTDNGYDELSSKKKAEIDDLWRQCLADWQKFKTQPAFLQQ